MPRALQIDVRRLAAIDMHGAHGTRRRRRVIASEFVLGAVVGVALGVFTVAESDATGLRLFGVWVAGLCVNYVPLAVYALAFLRPGRLEAELAGVDISRELRHYTVAQFWIAVPLLFVVLDVVQRRGCAREVRARGSGSRRGEGAMDGTKVGAPSLQAFLDAFNAHDVDAVMSFFTEDCVFDMPRGPAPGGRRLTGKQEVRAGIQWRFDGIPDVQYGDDRHWTCGDRGVSEWTIRGTQVTGERIEVRGCDLFEFADGKISRKDSFWKIVE